MKEFILTLTEVECDDDFNPKRYRSLRDKLVFTEEQFYKYGKQPVYIELFERFQKSLDDMKTMYLEDKINTDDNSLIAWKEYKKEG